MELGDCGNEWCEQRKPAYGRVECTQCCQILKAFYSPKLLNDQPKVSPNEPVPAQKVAQTFNTELMQS
ncbi:hypothetical protein NDU88_011808 [Pleurodeles waltl]|uniref:Uncharacterized protein n=1 Tax=Pleurodeles waltl TaxID=8319 RepID=A0AAV7R131_PLEWA|nr:hypothetical protein NDU88_011808 [Pleurodeles waltl]